MKITRQAVAQHLIDHLQHKITAAQLVDWAEAAMMEGEFEEEHLDVLREIVSRLGLTDVKAFGLTWEDCDDFLSRLGYRASVSVAQPPATTG